MTRIYFSSIWVAIVIVQVCGICLGEATTDNLLTGRVACYVGSSDSNKVGCKISELLSLYLDSPENIQCGEGLRIYEFGQTIDNTYLSGMFVHMPTETFLSWIAHYAGMGLIKTNNTYAFVPNNKGNIDLGNVWKQTDGPIEKAIKHRLEDRVTPYLENSTFVGVLDTFGAKHFSVIIDPCPASKVLWEIKKPVLPRESTFRDVIDYYLENTELQYQVQGAAVYIYAKYPSKCAGAACNK